jgi:hypothetical protein
MQQSDAPKTHVVHDVAPAVAGTGAPVAAPTQSAMVKLLQLRWLRVMLIVAVLLLGAWWCDSDSTHTAAAAAAAAAIYNNAAAAVEELWLVLVATTSACLATHVTQTNMSLLAVAALVCAIVVAAVKHKVCAHLKLNG